jgi:formiminoglutamase
MKFQPISTAEVRSLFSLREKEIKIGETIVAGAEVSLPELKQLPQQYVIVGIPEDIGPQANLGRGGAQSAWEAFLPKLLSLQETTLLKGSQMILLGAFTFETVGNTNLASLRERVSRLDQEVTALIKQVVAAGKIPIVIGGGHNNSYGLIKGASLALKQDINCINLDPHADYRPLEGRHSGNGFSYAKKEGFLNKYFVCGLHENYNSQNMLHQMKIDLVGYNFFDEYVRGNLSFETMIEEGLNHVEEKAFGIELDCDSIENFPASAATPSGISANQARYYVSKCGNHKKALYLHLPEAAPILEEGSSDKVGKLLAYLVSDFVKSHHSTR